MCVSVFATMYVFAERLQIQEEIAPTRLRCALHTEGRWCCAIVAAARLLAMTGVHRHTIFATPFIAWGAAY
jgi:hypothetical protein